MNTTRYVIGFIFILTATVAIVLTGLREVTKEKSDQNKAIFEKRAVLAAVDSHLGTPVSKLGDEKVASVFENQVDQYVLNMNGEVIDGMKAEDIDMAKERKKPEAQRKLPLYVFNSEQGEQFYIVAVRGNGLWDEIWGNIALESDLNTIAGASFDHKGETPGLGAEIKDNPNFAKQFVGKQLYNGEGEFVSVDVVKGGAPKGAEHKVDGISGATITADGVAEMMDRGIRYYEPYFEELKKTTLLTQ